MFDSMRSHLETQLEEIRGAGLEKLERVLKGPQGAVVSVMDRDVLNLCANNYLGLADDPAIVEAAKEALDRWGYGMASVRFICGTQEVHKELEAALTEFLGTEDTILYSSCFDANGGIFEALLDEHDAVISDALNHASIIDGIRLCKAKRLRYANRDMEDLERQLKDSAGSRFRMVVTDGVFSMDGYLAPLPEICELAERHDALVMVDDSHAVGFMGAQRPRHSRAPGRHGEDRRHQRDSRQGPRRSERRIRLGAKGAGGHAPAALASLSVLQLRGSSHRGGQPQGSGADPLRRRIAAAAPRQHGFLPPADDRGGL